MPKTKATLQRNNALYDRWSAVHLVTGIVLGWIMNPWVALLIMAAWEPLEIFVLSPLFAKRGIVFGYETWRNSLSDIVFDAVGVALGAWTFTAVALPPIHLF